MTEKINSAVEVSLRRISAQTVSDICDLSETLSEAQRNKVADNGTSIAEAHFSENAWFRAVYADEVPVGFVMLHIGSDYDVIDCPGAFLWRFMIAGPFQRMGYGEKAIALVVREMKARGFAELFTSYGLGEASPEGFYKRLGFVTTGETYDDEVEAVLSFAN
ncbi:MULTISPECIES: GNAT family N-acetyltransferase [Aminobacter]|uniref:Acetyltransferase n=2 Tax=Aminobacter TaxID=31988 RepID=A0AAC8YPG2_AMIAI|nr:MULTISPECIES: GNAT family N-acetyltransferase [Aminobacter]AMS42100.1 acetyltransferase [Aminobacter aminovorans]MBA8906158.1 diamine N-acetyltransferase [Aminobacter ciceronei]MBA9019937.1 diamine N-acetyltransferase [Aminobacter ciceronei]MBB3706661.1 diamine N-acetyltransferase [Aminobacter aminovorans]QNH32173.1 GNAT family N-acetyltransferase [Aminobacter sp. MDW-2]